MCLFRKKKVTQKPVINSKFQTGNYVDFFYKDDVFFGTISDIYLDNSNNVLYDIDIAGQCPATLKGIKEEKVIRIKKEN